MPNFDIGDQPGDSPFSDITPNTAATLQPPTSVLPVTQSNFVKSGDTWPPLIVQLCDSNGPVDLSAAGTAVTFKMRGQSQVYQLIEGACTIVGGATGEVSYQWGSVDTAVADIYNAEFAVSYPAGGRVTFPDFGYFLVFVTAAVA